MRIARLAIVIGIAAVAVVYAASAVAQKHGAAGAKGGAAAGGNWIEGVSTGRNLVVDMTYPVSDKFPAWPGDDQGV